MIVEGDRIVAAGCFLPLSEREDVESTFGARHRAALGLAEETDALVVVVSEENGAVSLAHDGNIRYNSAAWPRWKAGLEEPAARPRGAEPTSAARRSRDEGATRLKRALPPCRPARSR